MARVGVVVCRLITNFMGSSSSSLKDSMKLAWLVLLCNFLCSFSVVLAFISDEDLRKQIDKANNRSQPSSHLIGQIGTGLDRVIPLFNVSSQEGRRLFKEYVNQLKPPPPPHGQIAHPNVHLHEIIDGRPLPRGKSANPPSLRTPQHLLTTSSISVPVLDLSRLQHTWMAPVSKRRHFKTGITISPDMLLSTRNTSSSSSMESSSSSSSSPTTTTTTTVDVTLVDGQNSSDHQQQNFTLDYTTYSALSNQTIGCNATVKYFITRRAESMQTVFFTHVRLSLGADYLHEAFVLVNISTTPGPPPTDIWLSVTLNEMHTVTMRLSQFSMVFDISRFLRTIIAKDPQLLSIRFFCECHRLEKVTQCPRIRYHRPKILVKFC